MNVFRNSALTALFIALSACGGAPVEPATPPAAPAAPAAPEAPAVPATPEAPKPAETAAAPAPEAPAAPAHEVWSDKFSKDQAVAFMKKYVAPEMEPVFKGANAKRYGDFSCKTCHGPKYQNPKEYLPKLTMQDGKITAFASKPEVSKFMAEQVVPHMASALGLKPYDMTTHTGFGCAGCHTIVNK